MGAMEQKISLRCVDICQIVLLISGASTLILEVTSITSVVNTLLILIRIMY